MKKIPVFAFYQLMAFFIYTHTAAQWSQKSFLPAIQRDGSASFVIDSNAYIVGGRDSNLNILDDVWCYNRQTDSWTQKSSLIGGGKYVASGFQIGGVGYICNGWTASSQSADLLKYNVITNTWIYATSFPGGGRYSCGSFVIDNKAYVGFGFNPAYNDLWEYDPATTTWTQKATFPLPGRTALVSFSINGIGYIGSGLDQTGISNGYTGLNDFYKYDPVFNTWSSVSMIPGPPRHSAFSFVIGNVAYVGCGLNGNGISASTYNSFYKYDAVADSWSAVTSLPSNPRQAGTAFAIGNFGYVFGGRNQNQNNALFNDLWEYCETTGITNHEGKSYFRFNYDSENNHIHWVYLSETNENAHLAIYDVSGKQIISVFINPSNNFESEGEIPITHLNKGIYLYRLTNHLKNIIQTGKFPAL